MDSVTSEHYSDLPRPNCDAHPVEPNLTVGDNYRYHRSAAACKEKATARATTITDVVEIEISSLIPYQSLHHI